MGSIEPEAATEISSRMSLVRAAATVGLLGREGDLPRKTIILTAYYCLAAGAVAFIFIHGLGFNLGTILLVLLLAALALVARWMLRQKPANARVLVEDGRP